MTNIYYSFFLDVFREKNVTSFPTTFLKTLKINISSWAIFELRTPKPMDNSSPSDSLYGEPGFKGPLLMNVLNF